MHSREQTRRKRFIRYNSPVDIDSRHSRQQSQGRQESKAATRKHNDKQLEGLVVADAPDPPEHPLDRTLDSLYPNL